MSTCHSNVVAVTVIITSPPHAVVFIKEESISWREYLVLLVRSASVRYLRPCTYWYFYPCSAKKKFTHKRTRGHQRGRVGFDRNSKIHFERNEMKKKTPTCKSRNVWTNFISAEGYTLYSHPTHPLLHTHTHTHLLMPVSGIIAIVVNLYLISSV